MLLEFITFLKESVPDKVWSSIVRNGSGKYGRGIIDWCPEITDKGYILESVDGYGGEDMGSEYWGVFKLTKNEQSIHFRIHGYYESYHGVEFYNYYDLEKVVQKPVTRMEWVNE